MDSHHFHELSQKDLAACEGGRVPWAPIGWVIDFGRGFFHGFGSELKKHR